jgi:hypothetical protein
MVICQNPLVYMHNHCLFSQLSGEYVIPILIKSSKKESLELLKFEVCEHCDLCQLLRMLMFISCKLTKNCEFTIQQFVRNYVGKIPLGQIWSHYLDKSAYSTGSCHLSLGLQISTS